MALCPQTNPGHSQAGQRGQDAVLRAVDWPIGPHLCGQGQLGSPTKSQKADSFSFLVSILASAYLCLLPK